MRIYFLQQRFNLSDPTVEEARCDSAEMRQFVDIGKRAACCTTESQPEDTVPDIRVLTPRPGFVIELQVGERFKDLFFPRIGFGNGRALVVRLQP
jgi:hypothetical protein